MRTITLNTYIATVILTLSPALVWAHGEESHKNEMSKTKIVATQSSKITTIMIYSEINKIYLTDIRPIFEKKCFDCHADLKNKPWYYKVPGVKQMINKDIVEAKEHMDMRKDFPFISHESPMNDLKSIKKIGIEGGMPPLRYILGHWDSKLTDTERKKIISWTTTSIKLLSSEKNNR